MKLQTNEYALVRIYPEIDSGLEPYDAIVKQTGITDSGKVRMICPAYQHLADTTRIVDEDGFKVLANLGVDPQVTSIDSHRVLGTIGHKTIEPFGKIYFFYKPEKAEFTALKKALTEVGQRFESLQLNILFEKLPIEIYDLDSKPFKNGCAQLIHHKQIDTYTLAVVPLASIDILEADDDSNFLEETLAYNIYRAYADYLFMSLKKHNEFAPWIKRFANLTKVNELEDTVRRLLDDYEESGMPLKDFVKTLDTDRDLQDEMSISYKDTFLVYLKNAAKLYKLSAADLYKLSYSEETKATLDTILHSNVNLVVSKMPRAKAVSELATKNLRNFFIETMAYYFSGRKLESETNVCAKLIVAKVQAISNSEE